MKTHHSSILRPCQYGSILSDFHDRVLTLVEMVCGKEKKATSEPHNASRTRGSNFSNSSKPKTQNTDNFCTPAFQCLFETSAITSDMFFFSFAMVDVELFYVFVIAIRLTVLCKHRVFQAL